MAESSTSNPSSLAAPPRASRPTPEQIQASMAWCHRITRREAGNFYHGLKLTPEPRRSALYAVYAFMRACDDLVDEPLAPGPDGAGPSDDQIALARRQLDGFREQMRRVLDEGRLPEERPERSIWPAFHHVCERYAIRTEHLHAMLDGQAADITEPRYATFDQLYTYCYNVASVVGLVCVSVWGHDGSDRVIEQAEHRGIGLQLTNILRDLREDAHRGRWYLPDEDFDRFGLDRQLILKGEANAAFDAFMAFQIDRARSYYAKSDGLEARIDAPCRSTCWAMMRIYRGLLEAIARKPRRVLKGRVSLSPARKVCVALQARWLGPAAGVS